jgi:hypothetical protein
LRAASQQDDLLAPVAFRHGKNTHRLPGFSGQPSGADRATYHNWPWSAYPSILHTCGRDYLAYGQELSREQILSDGYHPFTVWP